MKIAVMGAGAYGTALGEILAGHGYDLDYYDPGVKNTELNEVLEGAEITLVAVPSKSLPYLLPHLPKNKPLIIATKGILSDKIFSDFNDYMMISGPGYAEDIRSCKKTKLTATDERIIKMFTTDYLTFDYTDDEKGVLMCGALKNVFAIRAGFLNLKPGTKEHEKYLRNAAFEMGLILAKNGARAETVELACGKGDLEITCYYPSRNYEFGQKLRENQSYRSEKTVEGVSALKRIKHGEIEVPEDAKILKELIRSSEIWA